MKHLFKYGLMNIACILNLLAVLFILSQWLSIKPNVFKIIVVTIFVLGLLSTVIQIALSLDFDRYMRFIDVVYKVSFVIFLICVLSSISKISILNIARGSSLYDKYSFPAVLPLVAGLLLFILKRK